MNTDNTEFLDDTDFVQFEYRLIYMMPNPHSEERLTVGLAASVENGVEIRMISSVTALDLLTHVVGEQGVEQFQYAASALRRSAHTVESVDALRLPTDLLVAGDRITAVTRDRSGLIASVLSSASTLIRTTSARGREVLPSTATRRVAQDLYERVSSLNPLKADDLFHKKVTVDGERGPEVVDLPILGNIVFGAPVSFTNASSDQKMRAEAYVAKFNWLRRYLKQRPKVYMLGPDRQLSAALRRAESSIRELKAVASASGVDVDISDSLTELASNLMKDEAA